MLKILCSRIGCPNNVKLNLLSKRCYASQETIMNVFDRNAKRSQRNRTAHMKDYEVYDYVKEEASIKTKSIPSRHHFRFCRLATELLIEFAILKGNVKPGSV